MLKVPDVGGVPEFNGTRCQRYQMLKVPDNIKVPDVIKAPDVVKCQML